MKPFKISACSANYGHHDLFKVIDRLASLNYDGVEITVMYHAIPTETSASRRKEIRQYCKDAGINISGLHFIFAPGLQMTSEDAGDRKRVSDHVASVIELAHDLDAPTVVVGGGGVRSSTNGMKKDVAIDRVIEVFSDIGRSAEKHGVTACFEALNRFETNIGRGFAECIGYLQRINSPGLKLCGDTFHMNMEETSMAGSIEAAASFLAHLHLPDSHRLAPGDGHIDFVPILKALHKINFGGYVSFEMFWIAPDIPYLPTYELCDAENVKGIKYIRALERTL